RLEIGDWRLEIGDWRLEIGDWRLEIGEHGVSMGFCVLDDAACSRVIWYYTAPMLVVHAACSILITADCEVMFAIQLLALGDHIWDNVAAHGWAAQ
ncbi:hypothetical protein, partial [Candidatus Viridilinea mediisalina]|uniref:hypothetical protein n=1 Tax=Candidatus Viridilinea mediisalina TaxID=2024553 RepID=UPI001C2B9B8A